VEITGNGEGLGASPKTNFLYFLKISRGNFHEINPNYLSLGSSSDFAAPHHLLEASGGEQGLVVWCWVFPFT